MNPREAESIVLNGLNELLGEKQSALLEAGLRLDVIGPERSESKDGGDVSEIRLYFYDFSGELEDAVEFFVVWNGKVNDPTTLLDGVREDIDDVLSRRTGAG